MVKNDTILFADPQYGTVDQPKAPGPKPKIQPKRKPKGQPAKNLLMFAFDAATGIEYIDLKTGLWDINHYVRGACLYGVLPANGYTYAPPHPCSCYR